MAAIDKRLCQHKVNIQDHTMTSSDMDAGTWQESDCKVWETSYVTEIKKRAWIGNCKKYRNTGGK